MNSHRMAELLSQPWAYHRDYFHQFALNLMRAQERSEQLQVPAGRVTQTIWGDAIRQPERKGSLAIIPVDGAIVKGAAPSDQWIFGITSDENIRSDIEAARNDGAESILLDFNTPGGTVLGMQETSGMVESLQQSGFPIFAFTSDIMASKGYAIAVGSTGIFTTPSAITGSVGVISASIHVERMLENAGIKVEVSASGDLKAAGAVKNLSEAQKANRNETVAKLAEEFFGRVRANRPNVKEEVFRGGYGDAKWALSNGLIDGVVNSRREVEDMILGTSPV